MNWTPEKIEAASKIITHWINSDLLLETLTDLDVNGELPIAEGCTSSDDWFDVFVRVFTPTL